MKTLQEQLLEKYNSANNGKIDRVSEIDNAKMAEVAPALGLPAVNPTSIPLQQGLSNEELSKQVLPDNYNELAQAEANEQSIVDRAPAVQPGGNVSRGPAGFNDGSEDSEPKESQLEKLERMMAELNGNRSKDLEEAASRQHRGNLMNALASNIGNIVGGAQAMNTKASVKPVQTQGMQLQDLAGIVEKKYKPEQEQLMAQYKALKDANQPMTEYQKAMLGMMASQQALTARGQNYAMERYYGTDGRLRDKQNWTEKEKNELSDKQTSTLEGYGDTKAAFKRIRDAKKGINTGPLSSMRNKVAGALGIDDENVTALKAELIDTLATKIKALSGTAANESEVKRLEVTLPSLDNDDDTFMRLLNDAEKRVDEARQIRLDHYRKQGKDPSAFETPKAPKGEVSLGPTSATVKIQGPSGQVATVSAEKAEKYLSQPGYKRVD